MLVFEVDGVFDQFFLCVCLCLCLIAGSGFVSQDLYIHGFFSASVKLPTDYTAGVVVAFYVSSSRSFSSQV